ncbi:hypothetical protein OB69_03110 [Roseivirga seohaensis subsp. aquiponti]|uniref:asparagine synthase (glutamine-hydrolyzing) n=1 Tax=Roseivirga seohaensis subsp. aquiponti TaxID=1566026 RepID=A0A0L8ANG1_9BACT|nr:asparagine synthase (glutamine-hydrolyzing) [Roseivirga seohaensis]KOF04008.1 hypothetical protein OB69_03110 [Roseivirga seohaensis subsp. aquiponti]
MCGITGFVQLENFELGRSKEILRKMTDSIVHRGPDSDGFWLDEQSGVALGHRRLSILDLSEAGSQPMISANGQYVIVLNGEIYNHLSIRKEISFTEWRGHSDTETILEAIVEWGFKKTLEKIEGMFAFALWDCKKQQLILARDRMGEKPLFYGKVNGTFFFTSELKALYQHPNFEKNISRDAIAKYVRKGYTVGEDSIFDNVKKIIPSSFLVFDPAEINTSELKPERYWSLESYIKGLGGHRFSGDLEEAVGAFETLLLDVVKSQMLSDVPLGAFLSGGIDSSLVVSMMQQVADKPIKTFTIGFHDEKFNEAVHAKNVSDALGTEHTELIVTEEDYLDVVDQLPEIYDEPFADSSQIPTILVSRLAKQNVTVALSGDGGDELFSGYDRYKRSAEYYAKLNLIPLQLRKLGRLFVPAGIAEGLASPNIESFYSYLNRMWKGYPTLVKGVNNLDFPFTASSFLENDIERLMFQDTLDYLPDDILQKVDRAAMSSSLETRVPLLNHRIVEFAWSLPIDFKSHNGINKWPMKNLLHKYVPRDIVERPKKGFSVPVAAWLRGHLKSFALDLLSEESLRKTDVFDKKIVSQQLKEHMSGKKDRHATLWTILMYQAWYYKHMQ